MPSSSPAPSPSSLRKTAKHITFQDPLVTLPHCTLPHGSSPPSDTRKTTKTVQFRNSISNSMPQRPSLSVITHPNMPSNSPNSNPAHLPLLVANSPSRSLNPSHPVWLRHPTHPQQCPRILLP